MEEVEYLIIAIITLLFKLTVEMKRDSGTGKRRTMGSRLLGAN